MSRSRVLLSVCLVLILGAASVLAYVPGLMSAPVMCQPGEQIAAGPILLPTGQAATGLVDVKGTIEGLLA